MIVVTVMCTARVLKEEALEVAAFNNKEYLLVIQYGGGGGSRVTLKKDLYTEKNEELQCLVVIREKSTESVLRSERKRMVKRGRMMV